jgi:hypothetical protein
MADASHPFDARRRRPRDWGDAFVNLPLETPPLSAWSQIAARLDPAGDGVAEAPAFIKCADDTSAAPPLGVTAIRARRTLSPRTWLALAASLSALALLPMLWSDGRDASDTATPVLAKGAPKADLPREAARAAAAAAIIARAPLNRTTSQAVAQIDRLPLEAAPQIASVVSAPSAQLAPPLTLPADAAIPAPDTIATALVTPDALPANAVLVGEADADATIREMEMLYTASAQLETLLTYARDPRVETGPAAALSSQIHSRLAKIDARLSLPDLSAHEQYALWQARVGTLRQAVAFESELRALAAQGQGYEGQLVEVY